MTKTLRARLLDKLLKYLKDKPEFLENYISCLEMTTQEIQEIVTKIENEH